MLHWSRIVGAVVGLLSAGFLASAAPSCSSSSSGLAGLDQGCSINSDCDSPLICAFGRCHSACMESRDCSSGERCVESSAGTVCELPEETTCSASTTCATGLVCASDQQCRAPCVTMAQCVGGQLCVTSGTVSACYDSTELDGGVSPVGDGASSGGGDSTTSGGDDSSTLGPEGDAACVSFLPDGGCYSCTAGLCAGGTCVNGNHDYSCNCFSGYAGTGTKTCVISNSCSANDQCPVGYPCLPTAPPGQACLGEFASWPMPDDTPGAKVAPLYANGGDGTVTDQVTGLVWQGQLASPSNSCSSSDAGPSCNLPQAEAYCGSLQLGGHGGWRLPTKIELESLLDCAQETPPSIANAFNSNNFTTPAGGNAAYFWTSSQYEGNGTYWLVNFGTCNNYAGNAPTEADISVRCVYGTGITAGTAANHYTINTAALDAGVLDGGTGDTVTDNRTGLTWERGFQAAMTTANGQIFCAALGGGFRLPTYKELLTLVDPVHFSPAIDQATFPGTPNDYFGTSTVVEPPNGNEYFVNFTAGATQVIGSTSAYNIRCVK